MTRHTTIRLRSYAIAGLVGLIASLATGRPEPAIAGASLLVLVVAGLEATGRPTLGLTVGEIPVSMVEGDEATIELTLTADERVDGVRLDLGLSEGLTVESVEGASVIDRTTIELDVAEVTTVACVIRGHGWGRRSLGPFRAVVSGPLGILELRQHFDHVTRIVSIPADATLSALLEPRDTNLHSGDLVSKHRGSGLEFAELRPYRPGDDARSLNWRVSSRAGERWVNQRHPERSGDILVVVDAQTESAAGTDFLVDRAVRLAGSILREYGRRRYRIGLVTVGGVVRWAEPGAGEAHRRRLIEMLLSIREGESNRYSIERAVMRAARKPALAIILTPLLDDTLAGLAHSMRESGLDIAMVELDPSEHLPEPSTADRRLGRRLWHLERQRLRDLLAADGIPVALWTSDQPPDVPLTLLSNWRSTWRLPV